MTRDMQEAMNNEFNIWNPKNPIKGCLWEHVVGDCDRIGNPSGGVGEIGHRITNASVYQKNTVGRRFQRHSVSDEGPAPKAKEVIQFECDDKALAIELGLHSYPVRAFGSSNPNDIFQVEDILRPAVEWLQDHYDRIGITHANKIIYDNDFAVARDYPEYELDVFFFGPAANKIRPDEKRLKATLDYNNKNYLIQVGWDLNMNTPDTFLFSSTDKADIGNTQEFPVVLKIGTSVSGLGFKKCYSKKQLLFIMKRVPAKVNFQVQEFMEGAIFYSYQWLITRNKLLIPITGTCNFIEGDANHNGNYGGINIPHDELERFTRSVAMRAVEDGLKGWIGFDVAFYEGKYYLIECNPRYTGAAYPFIISMKLLGVAARDTFWAHKNYDTVWTSIEGFDLGGLVYSPETREGWIVINPGPMSVGDKKVGILYIGPEDKYEESEKELIKLLMTV